MHTRPAAAALTATFAAALVTAAVALGAEATRASSVPTVLSYEISISGEYQRVYVIKGDNNNGTTRVEFAWVLHPTAPARIFRSGSDYVISGSDVRLKGSTVKYEQEGLFEERTPDGQVCTTRQTEHLQRNGEQEMQGAVGGRLYGGLRFSSVLAVPRVRQQTEHTCGDNVTTTARQSYALYAVVKPRDRDLEAALDHAAPVQVEFGSSFQVRLKASDKVIKPSSRLEESWEYTYKFRLVRG